MLELRPGRRRLCCVHARSLASVALLFVGLAGNAQARAINYNPTLAQLETPSAVVCNGEIISTPRSGPDLFSVYKGNGPQGYPETWMSARVRVLHVFKGSAPAEIVFRYRVSQSEAGVDLPIHVRLYQGDRCRFFLVPAGKQGEFVSVLDGRIDDGFGVQILTPNEGDDSPPMSEAEVVKLAFAYLHREKPGIPYDPKLTYIWREPGGIVTDVYARTSNNARTPEAMVAVMGDRTIDEARTRLDGTQ
jgi:hypothetical protein